MKFIILSLFVLHNILQVFCVPDNSERYEGDWCELDNNQSGICKNARNCEYAINLFKARQHSEVSHCQFKGNVPIVCCLEGTPAPKDMRTKTTRIKTTRTKTTRTKTTRAQAKPAPTYPKSTKFKKALCENGPYDMPLFYNIFGGELANCGEFPFQVALGYLNESNQIEYNCGGSLIADDIVLTAAHCANRKNSSPVIVKLGRASLVPDEYDYAEGEDIEIQSITLHQNYSTVHKQNDIAIIKLKEPTKFTWPIERICLASDDLMLPKNYTITGFGRTDANSRKISNWLLKATINKFPFQECKDEMKRLYNNITESQFCALGYKGADSCQGDSGGPVSFIKDNGYYLYGIVSYGSGCGSAFPGIYTKVNKHLAWIDNVMYKFERN